MRAGDTAAYAVLVTRHAPLARRLAVLTGAGSDADDVLQEAFVKAFRSLARLRDDAPFRPWLLRIVVNEARNAHRGRTRRHARERRVVHEQTWRRPDDPADVTLDRDHRQRLLTAVQRLPSEQRDVVTCRYLLELSAAETAQTLDIPVGTVKSRLSRALTRLREEVPRD